jgi:hypothetical protein
MTTIIPSNSVHIYQVKNPVLTSNLLELKAIEEFRGQHPELSMNAAAIRWIDRNAATWRSKLNQEVT